MEKRSHYAKLNIYVTLCCQILTMICGIVIPRIMIISFGSELYGATSSITQFLSYITLLEGGICGVARAALYKPLADSDDELIGKIVYEIKKFFRTIGFVFCVYVIILACSFKTISNLDSLDWISSFLLVLVISISTFAQYFIGISYSVLIQAAQRTYITNIINIVGTIVNTILVIILAYSGCNLIVVKLVSGCVFALKPVALWLYTRKKFHIAINRTNGNEIILKDKWVALGQHIAYFLHTHTDIAVLTILGNLKLVAVYSVYNMVISAMQNIMSSFSTGMESLFGDMYARKEYKLLAETFSLYETLISIVSLILFSVTAILIVPFVKIYTSGVTDANYIQPAFGLLLTVAALLFAMRTPYHSLIIAAGHFRQTNIAAYGEAVLNICLSVILVIRYGLIGVAIGTVIATCFRYIYYVVYLSTNIISRNVKEFVKRIIINSFLFVIIYLLGKFVVENQAVDNYLSWVLLGGIISIIAIGIIILTNVLTYGNDCKMIIQKVIRRQSR